MNCTEISYEILIELGKQKLILIPTVNFYSYMSNPPRSTYVALVLQQHCKLAPFVEAKERHQQILQQSHSLKKTIGALNYSEF